MINVTEMVVLSQKVIAEMTLNVDRSRIWPSQGIMTQYLPPELNVSWIGHNIYDSTRREPYWLDVAPMMHMINKIWELSTRRSLVCTSAGFDFQKWVYGPYMERGISNKDLDTRGHKLLPNRTPCWNGLTSLREKIQGRKQG